MVADSGRRPGAPPVNEDRGAWWSFYNGHVVNLSDGQAPAGVERQILPYQPMVDSGNSNSRETVILSQKHGYGVVRDRHDAVWWRDVNGPNSPYLWYRPVQTVPCGWGSPTPGSDWIGSPADPNEQRQRSGDQPTPYEQDRGSDDDDGGVPPFWQWWAVPVGASPPTPHVRQPPRARVRERKNLSKVARVGIFLWRMMDTVSELTEIGGAIYDALPKEIRDKADCPKGVSIGQYGSDLNTCMVKTLVANWDKLDTAEAFKNIAKNVVEDMTIGQFHKWLGKVMPKGFVAKSIAIHEVAKMQPEKYIATRLREVWDFLGI